MRCSGAPHRSDREEEMSNPRDSPDKSESESNAEPRRETAYERLMRNLHSDPKWFEEVCLDRRIGLYKFRGEIGSGNFSQVKMAVHQLTNERVAIKVVDKSKLDEKTVRMLNQEISTMEAVYHPNLIRLYEVVETYSKLYLVMEFANGGELYDKVLTLGKLDELVARQLFAQICSAVEHMHRKNIIHRDIKAENVFFYGPDRVKLGDFGLSAQLTEGPNQLLNTICGSPPSAAPELFCEKTYVGAPVDIWALGILLYFMVVGLRPFGGKTVPSLKKNIISGVYQMPRHLSRECAALIDGILKQNPSERLTITEILASDWLKGIKLPSACEVSQSFTLVPTIPENPSDENNLQMSEIEIFARKRLEEVGITSQLLASHAPQGSRSHVIGCYRIVIHRIQRQFGLFLDYEGHGATTDNPFTKPEEVKGAEKRFFLSKFCQKKQGNESVLSNCWRRRKSSSDEDCYTKGKDGSNDGEATAQEHNNCLENDGRVSIFKQIELKSAPEKGEERSSSPSRSRTCAII